MTPSPNFPVLLLGLKGTGKTHYLVALDWVMDRQQDPDGLIHEDLANDRSYLQPLREMWLKGLEFERTSRTNPPPPHHLLAKHPPSGTSISLHLPDLAGETFDSHFVKRSFPTDFAERIKNAAGILLFVHCDSNADHTILDDPALLDPEEPTPESPPAAIAIDWTLEEAALQTKLVELLQFASEVREGNRALRIAVMLSAWELVEKQDQHLKRKTIRTPDDFFSKNWPLLRQFLKANSQTFESRIYGISARGGGASDPEIQRLIEFENPTERILVVDDSHRSSDLSRPIRWILNLIHPTPQPDA